MSIMQTPKQTNHVLHLILTIFTCGLWAPVWIIVHLNNAGKTETTVIAQLPQGPITPNPDNGPDMGRMYTNHVPYGWRWNPETGRSEPIFDPNYRPGQENP